MAWERKGEHLPVGHFSYRHEAELAAEMLRSQGIPSLVFGDDCGGGLGIGLAFSGGIALYVHERLAARAKHLLEAGAADDDGTHAP